MTIAFPRTLPCGVMTSRFHLDLGVSVNRLNGGASQVRQFAEPRWIGDFTYAPALRSGYQQVEAWIDSLRGGLRDFYGHDPLRPFPIAYPRGAYPGGFSGVGTVTLLGPDWINVVTTPGFVLKAGDHVGLVEGTKRGLFRIVEDIAGSPATLWVEPPLKAGGFSTAATVNFSRPVCTMTIDHSSISTGRTARSPSPISFSAIQKVY